MTCERCENIHDAQERGLTNRKCECDCHNDTVSGSTWATNSDGYNIITNINTCASTECSTLNLN